MESIKGFKFATSKDVNGLRIVHILPGYKERFGTATGITRSRGLRVKWDKENYKTSVIWTGYYFEKGIYGSTRTDHIS